MSKRHEIVPSVDVFHKVTNVDTARINGLHEALVTDVLIGDNDTPVLIELSHEPKRLQKLAGKLLKTARQIRSEVLVPAELSRLYEHAGIRGVTEEHVDELMEYLGGVLPGYDPNASDKKLYDTPMLPVDIEELNSGLVLSVAGSQEVLQERALVKGSILNFYRLRGSHADAWFGDEHVTRAWLARSGGSVSNELLLRLKTVLDEEPELLPPTAHIGGAIIRPNPIRKSHP